MDPSVSTSVTTVRIPVRDGYLWGELVIPASAVGLVLFAHGSGSSRHSPRNQRVARALERGALGTMLFDLLTGEEERVDEMTAELRFDIPLLAGRLIAAIDWARRQSRSPIGCFGASTGAAAALIAAAERPDIVGAVVSRGGRPDLAGDALPAVRAPTLLIVGGDDDTVLGLNRAALAQLTCEKRLEVVPGATHLFEEPGALDRVIRLAGDWLREHLARKHA